MMEFKIQLSIDGGKSWIDSSHNDGTCRSFKYVKNLISKLRVKNSIHKYRIVGRELMPWCEIKED